MIDDPLSGPAAAPNSEFADHVGYAFDAFGLMTHHIEQLQMLTLTDDEEAVGSLVEPLGRLHAVLSALHYKYHEN